MLFLILGGTVLFFGIFFFLHVEFFATPKFIFTSCYARNKNFLEHIKLKLKTDLFIFFVLNFLENIKFKVKTDFFFIFLELKLIQELIIFIGKTNQR